MKSKSIMVMVTLAASEGEPIMRAIGARDAKITLGKCSILVQREPIAIEKHGWAVAVVMSADGYHVIKLAVMGEVKTYFRPEFINRIDEVVLFHPLDEKNIRAIARIQLQSLESG
jgi:hypothetical protein